MTVSTTDLVLDPDIGAFLDLLEQKSKPGQYVRMRRLPVGGNPWSVGQIRQLEREAFLEELAQRLSRIKSTDPIELQWMASSGKTVIDTCEVDPILEVMQAHYDHRMKLAKVENESQVVIGAMTVLGNVLMAERREATKERKENRILFQRIMELKNEVRITELLSDLGLGKLADELENEELGEGASIWDSPTVMKALDTFGETMGMPLGELGKLFRVLAARAEQTAKTDNGKAEQKSPPPKAQPDPQPSKETADDDVIDAEYVDVKNKTDQAETDQAETDGDDDGPSVDDIADTVVEFMDELLELAPDKLVTPERLAKLMKHRTALEGLMLLLRAGEETTEEKPVEEKPKSKSKKKKKSKSKKKKKSDDDDEQVH